MEEKNLEQEQERTASERPPFNARTSKLLGLFAATALAVSVGCSDAPAATEQAVGHDGQPINESDYCLDDNDDEYCDEDGSRISHSTFIWIGGINTGTKKYYKTSAPDATRTYKATGGTGVSAGTSGKPSSNTSQPPSSTSGTGQVINKSAPPASSSSGSSSSSKPSSGTVTSGSSSKSSSSSSGISSSSGKGGIGSSSSSSSS